MPPKAFPLQISNSKVELQLFVLNMCLAWFLRKISLHLTLRFHMEAQEPSAGAHQPRELAQVYSPPSTSLSSARWRHVHLAGVRGTVQSLKLCRCSVLSQRNDETMHTMNNVTTHPRCVARKRGITGWGASPAPAVLGSSVPRLLLQLKHFTSHSKSRLPEAPQACSAISRLNPLTWSYLPG